MASSSDEASASEEANKAGISDALPPLCTCTVSTITLRRERVRGVDKPADCPAHPTARVTHDSIAWERIPEQTVCICAHVKAVHTSGDWGASHPNHRTCSAPSGCRCPRFHDVDHPMPLGAFMDRLLHEVPNVHPSPIPRGGREKSNPFIRTSLALLWAWKQSSLALDEPRTWAIWLADSKRVWRAWRDSGGPASIPALEDR